QPQFAHLKAGGTAVTGRRGQGRGVRGSSENSGEAPQRQRFFSFSPVVGEGPAGPFSLEKASPSSWMKAQGARAGLLKKQIKQAPEVAVSSQRPAQVLKSGFLGVPRRLAPSLVATSR
ncbi:hypothetical protein H1C71_018543, partial [Ictidomys tridecemlineatus]